MHMQSFAYWENIWKQSPIILAWTAKTKAFLKTDVIIITCACRNEGCDIFFYRINVFECFSAEREKAANTKDLTHSTWLSFQYENASSNVLVWMRPQLFCHRFITIPVTRCKAGKYKELSNPFFFLTLPKTDGDFSVRNFAMIGICACIIPLAATQMLACYFFFLFFS